MKRVLKPSRYCTVPFIDVSGFLAGVTDPDSHVPVAVTVDVPAATLPVGGTVPVATLFTFGVDVWVNVKVAATIGTLATTDAVTFAIGITGVVATTTIGIAMAV